LFGGEFPAPARAIRITEHLANHFFQSLGVLFATLHKHKPFKRLRPPPPPDPYLMTLATQLRGHLVIRPSFEGQQNHLGSLDQTLRARRSTRECK
jgi:hypothetical protein